jgi:hypothetical protein
MSLFGKFMAVLNFLGVIAVLIFALLVYSQRRVWEYANYRHDLAMYGLPVTAEDTGNGDYKQYLDLGSPTGRTLKELFPTNPVTTQVQEVERVKQSLDAKLTAANDNRPLQMSLLAGTLLPLSTSNAQREFCLTVQTHCANQQALDALQKKMQDAYSRAVAAVKADPKKSFANEFALALRFPEAPVAGALAKGFQVFVDAEPRQPFEEAFVRAVQPDNNVPPNLNKDFAGAFNEAVEAVRGDLKQQYEAAFEEALKGQHTAGGKATKISLEQQRHAIARLLVDLDESLPKDEALEKNAYGTPAFQRVLAVIGVQEMNRELNAEAALLAAISQEQEKEIDRERSAFALLHQALIAEAQTAAQRTYQQDDQLTQLKEKIAAQTTLVEQRKKNVNDAKAELAARRKYTSEMLDIVRQITDSIHQTRVEVRDANAANQAFAEKIKELEKNR